MANDILFDVPEILRFGPITTKPGMEFNKQPNGDSVMWFKVKNVESSVVVKIDEFEIPGYFGGDLVTCTIPKKFFSAASEHRIYLYNKSNGLTSNTVIFSVKP